MLRVQGGGLQPAISRLMYQSGKDTDRALKELASGSRFVDAGVDPASQAISEKLRGQIKGFQAARNNAENASSFVQVAEGALNEQNNILIRMRELAVQSASDTYSSEEREFLNYEYEGLNQELERIAQSTKFGSMKLLTGDKQDLEFQVGVNAGPENKIDVTMDLNTTVDVLGTGGTDVTSNSDARDSLDSLDGALVAINGARAKLGAVQSRLDTAVNHTYTQQEALENARSKMADADIVSSISRVRRGEILLQYQAAALRGGMDMQQAALKLIG
mgnify:CR=1 FL=1